MGKGRASWAGALSILDAGCGVSLRVPGSPPRLQGETGLCQGVPERVNPVQELLEAGRATERRTRAGTGARIPSPPAWYPSAQTGQWLWGGVTPAQKQGSGNSDSQDKKLAEGAGASREGGQDGVIQQAFLITFPALRTDQSIHLCQHMLCCLGALSLFFMFY